MNDLSFKKHWKTAAFALLIIWGIVYYVVFLQEYQDHWCLEDVAKQYCESQEETFHALVGKIQYRSEIVTEFECEDGRTIKEYTFLPRDELSCPNKRGIF